MGIRGMVKSFLLKIIKEQNTLLLPYILNLSHHIKNKRSKLCKRVSKKYFNFYFIQNHKLFFT